MLGRPQQHFSGELTRGHSSYLSACIFLDPIILKDIIIGILLFNDIQKKEKKYRVPGVACNIVKYCTYLEKHVSLQSYP
jgi:hypothetical protein